MPSGFPGLLDQLIHCLFQATATVRALIPIMVSRFIWVLLYLVGSDSQIFGSAAISTP
jgi:hypothetical protein